MNTDLNKHAEGEGLALTGFRLNPDNRDPEIYTLIVYGEKDFPITINGRILFFSKPELVVRAYELGGASLKRFSRPSVDVDMVSDVAEMLYLIQNQDTDLHSIILNCLNTMFDLVEAAKIPMPGHHKQLLYELADHLTFNREFARFLEQKGINRMAVIDSVFWCIGSITTRATLLCS